MASIWPTRWETKIVSIDGLSKYRQIGTGSNYEYRGPWTSEEIYFRLRIPTAAEGAANVVRTDKLICFVPDLVELANVEQNLWVQNRITFAIGDLAGKKFFPWTLPELNNWWNSEGSSQFTNWPSETRVASLNHMTSMRYKEAANGFSEIMAVDTHADQSRCYAILAALMTDDVERAEVFSTAWKYPDARWARLGKLAIRLNKDAPDSASTDIAKLIFEFKTFLGQELVVPSNPVFRRINWAIYNKTLKELTSKPD